MSGPSHSAGRGGGRTPFVGRDAELATLHERLSAAGRGEGSVVLLAGEPGIGKTRLVAELADRAGADGWTVLTGRAYQADGLPPYLPWVEALRGYVRAAEPAELHARLGDGAAELARLLPELAALLPGLTPAAALSPEHERYRLFESVTEALLALARGSEFRVPRSESSSSTLRTRNSELGTGLLLVLDDIHWADVSSLQLLVHFARRLAGAPVLVAGTYRDIEVDRGHPFADVQAELVRTGVSDEIALRGLDEVDVGRFIELTAAVTPSPEVVRGVHRETEGNPLFVVELVRLLLAEGGLQEPEGQVRRLTIPRSVQQVIGRRLDRLSARCNEVLTLAAVIGREFSLPALGAAGEVHGDALLEALEEAESARVVAALPESPGRYAFTHPLIRETLYGQTLTSRRVRLHRHAGEALERLYAADPEPYLAELAHHFFQAAPGGDVSRAIEYARRAGDRAMALIAYEEAARLYTSAIQALALREPDEPLRCALLLELAEAQTRAGETAAAKETFQRTAALAASQGLAEIQGRAALGFGGYRGQPGLIDQTFVTLAESALAMMGSDHPPLRARLLARLAMELYFAFEYERCDALSREAVEIARRTGETATLAAALVGRHYATHTPDNVSKRLAITTELIRLAEAAGDREVAMQGYYLRVIDALEAGDIVTADAAVDAHERLAAEVRQPLYSWRTDLDRAMQATLEGRFADGLQLAQLSFTVASQAQIANALPAYGVQMLLLALLTGGDLAPLEPGWRGFTERFPRLPAYRGGLMLILLAQGREQELREHFETAADGGFSDLPRDDNMFAAVSCLAEVCAHLGDARRAAVLYDLVRPYSDRVVLTNAAVGCRGAFALYLGLLATTLGRWEAAEGHFQEALALNTHLRSRPYVLQTQLHHAEMLLRRGRPDDAVRAEAMLLEVQTGARGIGMTPTVEAATRLLDSRTGTAEPLTHATFPDGLSGREVDVLRLLAAGRTNREIAETLVLSTRTVDHHVASIYRKINARRRGDAAAYAQRLGLIPHPSGR